MSTHNFHDITMNLISFVSLTQITFVWNTSLGSLWLLWSCFFNLQWSPWTVECPLWDEAASITFVSLFSFEQNLINTAEGCTELDGPCIIDCYQCKRQMQSQAISTWNFSVDAALQKSRRHFDTTLVYHCAHLFASVQHKDNCLLEYFWQFPGTSKKILVHCTYLRLCSDVLSITQHIAL